MSMRVVIPSRQRVKMLAEKSLKLFPYATVSVAESEMAAYARVVPSDQLVSRPDSLQGMGAIRQHILDTFDDDVLIMADDDVPHMLTMVGASQERITNPLAVWRVLENAAHCAKGIGTPFFGFNQNARPNIFFPFDPMSLTKWAGGVIGFIGRPKDIRYDSRFFLRDDIDYSLQVLMKYRVIYTDGRFHFRQDRFTAPGGNQSNRTAEQMQREYDLLREKWGKYILVQQKAKTTRFSLLVSRKQPHLREP